MSANSPPTDKRLSPAVLTFALGFSTRPISGDSPLPRDAFGALEVWFGHLSILSVGESAVLGAMAASESQIAALPAVRPTFPDANPTFSLGIPLQHEMARWLGNRCPPFHSADRRRLP